MFGRKIFKLRTSIKWKFVAIENQKLLRISVLGKNKEISESYYLIKESKLIYPIHMSSNLPSREALT